MGVSRRAVLVHDSAAQSFDALKHVFENPALAAELRELWDSKLAESNVARPVNVSKVQHLSPFRYPGGKTWLVPEVRRWAALNDLHRLVEPFAGGASCGLAIAHEGLAREVVLGELDPYVASVWRVVFEENAGALSEVMERISSFEVTREHVQNELAKQPNSASDLAFQTILRNRCARGGIMAPGAGLTKSGEKGKGIGSRWYPETLNRRFDVLRELRDTVRFVEGDAFRLLSKYRRGKRTGWFIDPPYTASGKSAGRRLYGVHELDHERLFFEASRLAGPVMMTYDDAPEVRELARRFGFEIGTVPMKSTHHAVHKELILTKG